MNRATTGLLLCAALAASAAACTDVADERAAADARVGQEAIDVAEVRVDEGLATVRALEPGELSLWAQAPALTIRLSTTEGAPATWRLRMRNVMADATLSAEGPDGEALEVEQVEQPIPTESTWTVRVPPGQEATLRWTPPDAGDGDPWRFVVYADVQNRLPQVQDIYEQMMEVEGVRFGLISGDLTEQGTPEELEAFQRELRTLPFPVYATLGNHELGDLPLNFHRYHGRGNFSFAYRGLRCTLLDSASATIAPRVYGWLDGWLERGRNGLHLVMMHIPPIDPAGNRNGAFASRPEAHKLLGQLARGGVDLTIYGHVHTYRPFANAGIEAFITGGGGAIPQTLDGIGRHFLVIDVDPEAQQLRTTMVRVYPQYL